MAKRKRRRPTGTGAGESDQDVAERIAAVESWLESPLEGRYRDLLEALFLADKHGASEGAEESEER